MATNRNLWAVAALVLGICGLLPTRVGVLAALPAILCALLALRRSARLGGQGQMVAYAGLFLGGAGLALWAAMFCWAEPLIVASREEATRAACAQNLREVGLACKLYAQTYQDTLPADFKSMAQAKFRNVYRLTNCPGNSTPQAPRDPAALEDPDYCDYLYLGNGITLKQLTPQTVIAADRPGNHSGYINVLTGDGRVTGYRGESLESIARRENLVLPKPPAAAPRAPSVPVTVESPP